MCGRGGGCALRRDTLAPSRWRKPIRAGGVKFTQASSAALRDLGSYAASIISLTLMDHGCRSSATFVYVTVSTGLPVPTLKHETR